MGKIIIFAAILLPVEPPCEGYAMHKTTEAGQIIVNSSRVVHRARHFAFVVDDISLPNRNRAEIAWVRHPGSTAVVPLEPDGRIVMTRQYRHPVGGCTLEIPAGTTDPGEDPLACARRELEEETGLVAAHLEEIARIHILPSYSDELIHVFLARDFTRTGQNLDPDEMIEIERYTLDELMAMIDRGEITDALTILAMERVWRHRRQWL